MFFKEPAHLVYTSDSKQNIKILIGNFGAIPVEIMRAKFQASRFTAVIGE